MLSLARLALLLALAGCTAAPPPVAPPAPAATPAAGLCRIGPDDGPLLADRGIGGTGISAEGDRGIGGTGSTGGTGILGVITGFASVCVNGLEIHTAPTLAVELEGVAASPAQLRAGQVVVVEAVGPPEALRARRLAVRHEVIGPVEQQRGAEGLRVAGQEVRFTPEMRGGSAWRIGDWVAVSGLRRPDGRVMASRIDRRDPGPVLVRGIVEQDPQGLHIGALPFQPPLTLRPGAAVTVTGRFAEGRFVTESVSGDLLLTDPARAFGAGVERLVIDSYFTMTDGVLQLGGTSFGLAPQRFGSRRAVIDARREAGRGFTATEMRGPGEAPGSRGPLGQPGAARPDGRGMGRGGIGARPMGPRDRDDGIRGGDRDMPGGGGGRLNRPKED